MKKTYHCYNNNGSITGTATVTNSPDGIEVQWSQGSPWRGGHCDDGPSGGGTFPSQKVALDYLESHGFEVGR